MLLERISLEGIARVLSIPIHRLYSYLDEVYDEIPEDLYADVAYHAELELKVWECESDELWSFVGSKANKQWLWVALDRQSRQIVAVHVGSRGTEGAIGLWHALGEGYRSKATFYTDDWQTYKQVIPPERHKASDKKRHTNHVERFFCTLRQRAARLVRKTLSFSKKLDRHTKAIRYFVANYNLSLLL